MDALFEGAATSFEGVRTDLLPLKDLRNPELTPLLEELEYEAGILPDLTSTEAERRAVLMAKTTPSRLRGQAFALQEAITAAGYSLLVHENSPAVDPGPLMAPFYSMVAGNQRAVCGNSTAYASSFPGGELVVSGDTYRTRINYTAVAGRSATCCGNQSAIAGAFDAVSRELISFDLPTDPATWPFIFFVGGPATRDPVTDELLTIERANLTRAQRAPLVEMILRIKPAFTWCGLIVKYTD